MSKVQKEWNLMGSLIDPQYEIMYTPIYYNQTPEFANGFAALGNPQTENSTEFKLLSFIKNSMLLAKIRHEDGDINQTAREITTYIQSNSEYFAFNMRPDDTDAQVVARNIYTANFLETLVHSGISIDVIDTILYEAIYAGEYADTSVANTVEYLRKIASNPELFVASMRSLKVSVQPHIEKQLDFAISDFDIESLPWLKNFFGVSVSDEAFDLASESIQFPSSYMLLIAHCLKFRNEQGNEVLRNLIHSNPAELVTIVEIMKEDGTITPDKFETLPLDIKTQLAALIGLDSEIKDRIDFELMRLQTINIDKNAIQFDTALKNLSTIC